MYKEVLWLRCLLSERCTDISLREKSINILMIIDSLGTGGAEISLKTLTAAMADAGHKVVILVVRNETSLKMDPRVEVCVFGYRKFRVFPSLYMNAFRLKKFISNLEYKYNKFNLKIANLTLSFRLSHAAGIKDVYYCLHEDIVASNLKKRKGLSRYFRMRKIRKLFNNRNIITVSHGIKDSLESIKGLHCKSVQTIYNPVDMGRILRLAKKENPYADLDYIVHVGRFSNEKRHDLLLEAYSNSHLNYKLVLVGDGPERKNIEKCISSLDLGDRVYITGFIDNPYPVIRDAMVLVLSSEYEGFGVVLAEALCLGTAVVSTDCKSGPKEVMGLSLSKYLVPVDDAPALSKMIAQAINDVSDNKYPFSDAALQRFSPEVVACEYQALVND